MLLKGFSAQTQQGPVLQVNEDGYDFDFDNEIYMIFDGFGGGGIGDRAVADLIQNIKKFYTNITADRNATLPFYYSSKYLLEGNALINAALSSHDVLFKSNLEKDLSTRAGASGIIISKAESILNVLSTGNCRLYLLRKGKLQKIFEEDSFKLLSRDQHDLHYKNIPMSGYGLYPELHYQVNEVRVDDGDQIFALTDGVYTRVSENEITSTLLNPNLTKKEKIGELFDLANTRGNFDNQSGLLLEF